MQQFLTIWDAILTPIYLVVLIGIAKTIRDKKYAYSDPFRKYFLPGLYVKLGGAIFIALIYAYYYKGGDTYNFFNHSRIINSSLDHSLATWFKLMLRFSVDENPEIYSYASQMQWYNDPSSYTVAVIGALFGLLNGTTYLPTALIFAFLSYTGIWAMYRTFVNIYPKLHKPLAIAFLFIPSTFVWGSAIFKDTICMFGLGWMTYSTFRLFVNRDFSFLNLFILVFSFYLIGVVKLYILLAFLPALSLWLLMTYSYRIKTVALRWMINLGFIVITVAGFFYMTDRFAKELNKYSLERVAATAASTRGWISYVTERDEGSAYDLGEFEPTIEGMLTKFPQAVVVTLYRPFLWEVNKVIVALSALESFAFLILTIAMIRKRGFSFIGKIFNDPNLIFFLVFSLIFAFAVGISSYNFGALSRYKIPCMAFFAAFLLILYYHERINPAKKIDQLNKPKKVPSLA